MSGSGPIRVAVSIFALAGASTTAFAQGAAEAAPASEPQAYTLGGYAEAFYQWNFRAPSNDITNFRGFDNRHNTVTISNVALDLQWDYKDIVGRAALQVGHTPSTYYLAEPALAGASAASASCTR